MLLFSRIKTVNLSRASWYFKNSTFSAALLARYRERSLFSKVGSLPLVSRLYDALMRVAREGRAPRRLVQTPEIPGFTKLRFLPRDAYYCGGELVPVLDERERVNRALSGRICADQIVPYPPGIPVLVPGQLITPNIVEYVGDLLRSQKRTELHGIVYEGYQPCVRVLKPAEEKGLRRLG